MLIGENGGGCLCTKLSLLGEKMPDEEKCIKKKIWENSCRMD